MQDQSPTSEISASAAVTEIHQPGGRWLTMEFLRREGGGGEGQGVGFQMRADETARDAARRLVFSFMEFNSRFIPNARGFRASCNAADGALEQIRVEGAAFEECVRMFAEWKKNRDAAPPSASAGAISWVSGVERACPAEA